MIGLDAGYTGVVNDETVDTIVQCALPLDDKVFGYYYIWNSQVLNNEYKKIYSNQNNLVKIGFTKLDTSGHFKRYDSDIRQLRTNCLTKDYLDRIEEIKLMDGIKLRQFVNSVTNDKSLIECMSNNMKPLSFFRCEINAKVRKSYEMVEEYHSSPVETCMDMCMALISYKLSIENYQISTIKTPYGDINMDFNPNLFIPWLKSGHTEFFSHKFHHDELFDMFNTLCGFKCVSCAFDHDNDRLFDRVRCG